MPTKKNVHKRRKTRKINKKYGKKYGGDGGDGGGFFDSFTRYFKKTSDTNKDISEIAQLQKTLSANMSQLTETYTSVLKKVNTLQGKIEKATEKASD